MAVCGSFKQTNTDAILLTVKFNLSFLKAKLIDFFLRIYHG